MMMGNNYKVPGDITFRHRRLRAPEMADLLEYFEARSRALDKEGQPVLDASTLQFMSLIKFNGVPILPPVLTQGRREEMMSYKHEALRREKCTQAKKKEELHAKVQSIVAGVEERRAAKQAARALKSSKSASPSSGKSDKQKSEVISKLTCKTSTQAGSKVPSEIIVNVTGSSKESTSSQSKSSGRPSVKSSSAAGKHSVSPSRSSSQGSSDVKKKEYTNFKSLGKLGTLSKQKSYSSQHLDRSDIQPGKFDSDTSTSSAKQLSLSPNSRALLPHPPVGRPPSRGSSMRQSASTPDLRNIEVSVERDELRKPFPSGRSFSPKGGRQQTQENDSLVKTERDSKSTKLKGKESLKQNKPVEVKVKSENSNKKKEKISDQKTKQSETEVKQIAEVGSKKNLESEEKVKNIKGSVKPVDQQSYSLQNPLEVLEQELTKEEEYEMNKRFGKPSAEGAEGEVRQELDPIQTATAELFPFPISEEQALATLDSLQSDFASLDQLDSLPKDYNGIPLTSLKQQQIIHMLTKLSRALNMEDTLTSTTSSYVSGEPLSQGVKTDSGGENRSVPNGASGRSYGYSGQVDMSEIVDTSANVTSDSTATNSSYQNSSANSRTRMSPTGSSILSSASSVSASRSRMSPKSLKNTVHFSTLVTEISTSASQSYEDKISYRKLDITPKSSENFEDFTDGNMKSKNLLSEGQGARPGPSLSVPSGSSNMLSKVALSPSVDSSSGSPGEFQNHNPFENISQDSDLNTSDKENEFVPADPESSDENYQGEPNVRHGRNQPVLNVYTAHIPAGPIGENHPAVLKSSVKSDLLNGNSIKDGQEKVLQENFSKTNLTLDSQFHYGSSSNLDRYLQGKVTSDDSISSMQEEITRSYLLSQSKSESIYHVDENFEYKKATKIPKQRDELEDSTLFMKPVIFSNTGNSLKENRSMLDEEDMIRSNLQRVQLEDTESETEQISENLEEDNQSVTNEIEFKNVELVKDLSVSEFDEENLVCVQVEHPAIDLAINVEEEVNHPVETDEDIENEVLEKECDSSRNSDHQQAVPHETETGQFLNFEEDSNKQDNVGELQDEEEFEDQLDKESKQPDTVQGPTEKPERIEEETEQPIKNQDYDREEEAKAEHIQKYLNQVHEHSLHHDENNTDEVEVEENKSENFTDVMDNIGALIQSFTSSIQKMNHLSQEELFHLQTEQFELIQQKLIEHQRAQLEELFVAQRKEQMSLEQEIEAYQKQIKSTDGAPGHDPLKPQISRSMPQVTQAWQPHQHQPVHSSAKSPPFSVKPVAYPGPYQNSNMSFNTSYSTIAPFQDPSPYQNPRMCMVPNIDPRAGVAMTMPMGFVPDPNISSVSQNTSFSAIPHQNPGLFRGNQGQRNPLEVIHSQEPGSSQASNPFIYPSSPSLYINPKDRDNMSEASGFAKATPKQLVFSNHSTPVQTTKTYKPIQHSPVKQATSQSQNSDRYFIPEKVFDPEMQPKFDRVSAAVKGYLTRRLLRTPKVQEIIQKLSDTRNFAFSFQAETPIKKGTFSREDRILLERIVAQAALLDIHEIFFVIPVSERMAIITAARQLEQDRMLRESQRRSVESVSRSQPKLSKATLKAMERKKKAQLAEEAVFGSVEFRPKSAPPTTSSPHLSTDISGPLRRHYHSLFVRALRPLQGQFSPITADSQITVREMKERPRTAPEKKKSETNNKTKKVAGSKSGKSSTSINANKQKTTSTNTKTKKMDKAWR